jgi:hypothetical protein
MDLDGNPRQVGHVDMGAYESSTTTDAGSEPTMPAVAALSPPDRCPTADRVRFQLDVPAAGNADVRVFDVRGRQVRALLRGPIRIGRHEIAWDTRDATGVGVPCGVYFVRARFGGFIADRRVVVVK